MEIFRMSPALLPLPAAGLGWNRQSIAFVPASNDAASGNAQPIVPADGTTQSWMSCLANSAASAEACLG